MDIVMAKEIVQAIADGVDPATGELLPSESVFHSPNVIRALYTLIANVPNDGPKDPLRNMGKPWTKIEEDKLCDELLSKQKISIIAKEHGRSASAIRSHMKHLGLK